MDKVYNWNINSFSKLEKALNEWYNTFLWNIAVSGWNLSSLASLSKFSYAVSWCFYCDFNWLTSLEWCPKSIWWDFHCGNNELSTLMWAPKTVLGNFSCKSNNLTTLEWCPMILWWDFKCFDNKIIPLERVKWNVFKLWESIYIGTPNRKDIQNLVKFDITTDEWCRKYYNSFTNLIQSTVKLDKKDITDTEISFNGKKFKRKYLGL
jgi:hypothetical protein